MAIHVERSERAAMDKLIQTHFAAELRGDAPGAASVYTDDVVHDVIGTPHGPLHGRAAAQGFYEQLYQDIHCEERITHHAYYGTNHCTIEQEWFGSVPGIFMGVSGGGKWINFRVLHVFEFRDGKISRHNIWVDRDGVMKQLQV